MAPHDVRRVAEQPGREPRVHAAELGPVHSRRVHAEEDHVPDGVGKVPAKDVDDEGGDDEGVHAHERHDGEEDAARLVGPCEERDGKLDERGALRQQLCRRPEPVVWRSGVVPSDEGAPEPPSPRHVHHELCAHQIEGEHVLERRPQLAEAGRGVEEGEEELNAHHLPRADGEAHADEEVQVLRPVVVQVLPVVKDELVHAAERQRQHERRRDLRSDEDADGEDVGEHALDQDVGVVAPHGQEGHEGRIVLHGARRQPVPPVLERRRHLAVQRAVDDTETEGLPCVEPDDQLVQQSQVREGGAERRGGEKDGGE
mmetsp:Transcript_50058/g.165744  ORF Transcript_50058/g.165744 Transcript_50058/m.165744 type:complete len:314 (-) Transcript_50058:452-1393(-)